MRLLNFHSPREEFVLQNGPLPMLNHTTFLVIRELSKKFFSIRFLGGRRLYNFDDFLGGTYLGEGAYLEVYSISILN